MLLIAFLNYLLARFLIAILAYTIIGMLVMGFVKGAVGVERVPNIQFWLYFFGLVKVYYYTSLATITI